MSGLSIHPATNEDMRLLWEWANDPVTREASFTPALITWETHVDWFQRRVKDPNTRLLVARNADGEPVAQVRFDLEPSRAVVSLSVAPEQRGKGYGIEVLQAACKHLWKTANMDAIDAYIKPDNQVSLRTFARAGFAMCGPSTVQGEQAVRMTLPRAR